MTTTDDSFEAEVRAMLHRRAADVGDAPLAPAEPASLSRAPIVARRRRPALVGITAAAIAAIVVAMISVTLGGDGQRAKVSTGVDATVRRLPAEFDLSRSLAFFAAAGGPDEVAAAYLSDRLPVLSDRVERHPAVVDRGFASVDWALLGDGPPGGEGEPIYEGEVVLRESGLGWAVVLSTTEGVDLSELTNDGTAIRGVVDSSLPDAFIVEVYAFAQPGNPGGTFTDLMPTAADLVGTTGWVDPMVDPSIDVDVPVEFSPAVVRIRHEGGAELSITEIALDRPPHVAPGARAEPPGDGRYVVAEHLASDAVVGAIDAVFGPGLIGEVNELEERSGIVELSDITRSHTISAPVDVLQHGWVIHEVTSDGLNVELRPDDAAVARITPGPGRMTVRLLTAAGEQVLVDDERTVVARTVDVPVPHEGWLATRVDGDDGTVRVDLRPLDPALALG